MLVIHKQPLQPGLNHLSLPVGTEMLHAAAQGNDATDTRRNVCIWYLRPVTAPAMENRSFLWVGTGHAIDDPPAGKAWRHIATSIDGPFVWHVFELVSEPVGRATGEQLVGEGR